MFLFKKKKKKRHDDQCSSHKLTMSCFIKHWYIDIFVPVGKCSLIDQLSTCSVALPPFLVKRTTWYFPSFTGVLLSSTLMSTVPMLKVTPILPCCWRKEGTKRNNYDIVLPDVQVVLSHLTWCGSSIVAAQPTLCSACTTSSSEEVILKQRPRNRNGSFPRHTNDSDCTPCCLPKFSSWIQDWNSFSTEKGRTVIGISAMQLDYMGFNVSSEDKSKDLMERVFCFFNILFEQVHVPA